MSVIADFSVPAEAFVLGDTLSALPEITIRVERVVAHTEHSVTPYFRASGADLDRFEAALEADPSIEDVVTLEEVDDQRFYRANWVGDIESMAFALEAGQTAVMEATGEDGQWEFRLLFPDHEKLSEFDSFCRERDLSFELLRTFRPENPGTFGQYEVTDEQREALVLAFERGYFDVPRGTSAEDLAEELGVSAQAVSVRIRRGLTNLLETTLVPGD